MDLVISLKDKGNKTRAIWFLGQPPKPRVSLNFEERGPVTVDLDDLVQGEVEHILFGLKVGDLEVSRPYEELYVYYKNKFLSVLKQQELTTEAVGPNTVIEQKKTIMDVKAERDEKLIERCSYVVKQGVRSIKGILTTEEDIRVLRKVLEMEIEGKKRKSVLSFIQERIDKINSSIIQEIEKSASLPPVLDPSNPYDRMSYVVEEKESRPITVKFDQ